jgi:hypothetical protein
MNSQIAAIVCIGWNAAKNNLPHKPIGRRNDPGTLCRITGKLAAGHIAILAVHYAPLFVRSIGTRIAERRDFNFRLAKSG